MLIAVDHASCVYVPFGQHYSVKVIILLSELYREPPPEVSRTSDRPAAEGCEANDTGTPTTNIKYPGKSIHRMVEGL